MDIFLFLNKANWIACGKIESNLRRTGIIRFSDRRPCEMCRKCASEGDTEFGESFSDTRRQQLRFSRTKEWLLFSLVRFYIISLVNT